MPGIKHTRTTFVKNNKELRKEINKHKVEFYEEQLKKLKKIHTKEDNSL